MAEALMATSLILSAASSGYTASEQHKANKAQRAALKTAEKKQEDADYKAETQRLEALAKNQQEQGFSFGIDSGLARAYADAAQKWGAGTGSLSEKDEEDNPFYMKGLI